MKYENFNERNSLYEKVCDETKNDVRDYILSLKCRTKVKTDDGYMTLEYEVIKNLDTYNSCRIYGRYGIKAKLSDECDQIYDEASLKYAYQTIGEAVSVMECLARESVFPCHLEEVLA